MLATSPGAPNVLQPSMAGSFLINRAASVALINRSAADSKPYWQPQIVPPKGAPNVLLIITDDVGAATRFLHFWWCDPYPGA